MTQDRVDLAIKAARDCDTKSQWDQFFLMYGETLATTSSSKLVNEVFKKLQSDPLSLHYNPKLWGSLIVGSMACWNTELGIEVAEFTRKLTIPIVSIPAAQVLLEGGKPAISREFAQRALRLSSLSDLERIQLELIVASSFAEEGKTEHAVRVLSKVTPLVRTASMSQRERADFVVRLGRLQYFMGRYPAAGQAFEEAAPIMLELEDWEGAARALFNAGACIQNSSTANTEAATAMVERCRKLSMEHNLAGPMSHCEAFYGVEAFNIGRFVAARDHFRRAMTFLPASDKSFRRLHIMSFLSLTYFAMGKYALGIKFGRQTLDLAQLDASERFKSRYQSLEAEILWEEGKIGESMQLLRGVVHQLSLHGVRNLEELSTLTRYQIQLAILGETNLQKFKIDESLQKSQGTWIEYLYSCALLKCSREHFDESLEEFKSCYHQAKAFGSLHYQALNILAIIRLYLQKNDLAAVQEVLPCLEASVARIGDTPIRAKLQIVYAAVAYQSGQFDQAIKLLHAVDKMGAVSWADRFVVQSCLATVRGESPRYHHEWQEKMVARFVRGYFSPTIEFAAHRVFVVSKHYSVNLEKHPAMADLMSYLSERGVEGASLADIQTHVWKESLNAQGWQQKIRNTIMRLRDLFPYTIAPVVIHSENLRFFGEAIRVIRDHDDSISMEDRLKILLVDHSLSSNEIAEKLDVSLATAKRLLKKMTDERLVTIQKSGRSVVYSTSLPQ